MKNFVFISFITIVFLTSAAFGQANQQSAPGSEKPKLKIISGDGDSLVFNPIPISGNSPPFKTDEIELYNRSAKSVIKYELGCVVLKGDKKNRSASLVKRFGMKSKQKISSGTKILIPIKEYFEKCTAKDGFLEIISVVFSDNTGVYLYML